MPSKLFDLFEPFNFSSFSFFSIFSSFSSFTSFSSCSSFSSFFSLQKLLDFQTFKRLLALIVWNASNFLKYLRLAKLEIFEFAKVHPVNSWVLPKLAQLCKQNIDDFPLKENCDFWGDFQTLWPGNFLNENAVASQWAGHALCWIFNAPSAPPNEVSFQSEKRY